MSSSFALPHTLNSAYKEVAFNEKSTIMKENLHTKYTPFTYNDIALVKKLSKMKQNLHIFFFVIGRVECTTSTEVKEVSFPLSQSKTFIECDNSNSTSNKVNDEPMDMADMFTTDKTDKKSS